ncbi:MAG: sigma-70 family RNA polymerase sigma factor [Leptolyngbya sp. SIO1D8]|nr:sigma-70 family RNA polymerase sigma factor [Leptolyngbya sp. SIO1D8]
MTDSPLDKLLLELVQTAQNSPCPSRERTRALGALVKALRNSGKLSRPMRGQFQGFYNDIYEEALQRLFTYICERVDNYNPERANVLGWVNFLLVQRFFIEASREFIAPVYKGMDPKAVKKVSLEDLDRAIPSDISASSQTSLSNDLKRYIQEDPDQVFQATHIDSYPEVSFQWITLQRLDGYAWRELSDQQGIPVATLSSFYQRCLKKFAPTIRQDLL